MLCLRQIDFLYGMRDFRRRILFSAIGVWNRHVIHECSTWNNFGAALGCGVVKQICWKCFGDGGLGLRGIWGVCAWGVWWALALAYANSLDEGNSAQDEALTGVLAMNSPWNRLRHSSALRASDTESSLNG